MKSQIRELINSRYTLVNAEFGVDEEETMFAFCRNDLESLINNIVDKCADLVTDADERDAIRKFYSL